MSWFAQNLAQWALDTGLRLPGAVIIEVTNNNESKSLSSALAWQRIIASLPSGCSSNEEPFLSIFYPLLPAIWPAAYLPPLDPWHEGLSLEGLDLLYISVPELMFGNQ